jgi:hypothetical protein
MGISRCQLVCPSRTTFAIALFYAVEGRVLSSVFLGRWRSEVVVFESITPLGAFFFTIVPSCLASSCGFKNLEYALTYPPWSITVRFPDLSVAI